LSYRLRRELIDCTCRQVAGRVPVLVGITDTAYAESVDLAEKAKEAGAQAAVVSSPYYFAAAQTELLDYLEHLVAELPLPVFLYNAPAYTRHSFEPDTVRRAAQIPNVIGLKDSSCNMKYFHSLQTVLSDREDFTLLVGPEELMAEAVLLGGHGGMCGGANIYPQLYVDLYKAARAGNLEEVHRLQKTVMEISTTVYQIGRHDSSYLKGLKCAVSLMGICGDFMAEPFARFGSAERERVRQHLLAAGLLVPSHC
ncbi:MAG: dihydrodipicolinate synthase family protein, partial [Acidobacteria bacterium]|nr:dihydrodipicolinate synthase family protein [Acidobacteriota bacterium]